MSRETFGDYVLVAIVLGTVLLVEFVVGSFVLMLIEVAVRAQ